MNKRKIIAVAMLLAVFSSLFAFGLTSTTKQTPVVTNVKTANPELSLETSPEPNALGDDPFNYDIWAQEANMSLFTADGDLSEWTDIYGATFGSVNVKLAYDDTYVCVGLSWADPTVDSDLSQWNKTGLYNQTKYPGEATWELLDGADDIVQIGFSNDTLEAGEEYSSIENDFWVWTASNRTADNYALEIDGDGMPDGGTLPFEVNSNITTPQAAINGTAFAGKAKPIYDNSWTTIMDYTTIPNGTLINAWKNTTTTPTGSQTDVQVGWNNAGGMYYVEMMRALDTGNADDFVYNFSKPLYFHLGFGNMDIATDLMVPTTAYAIGTNAEDPAIEIDAVSSPVTSSLVITGTVFAEYSGYSLMIGDTAWADTYGTGPVDSVFVVPTTGEFNYLMAYNDQDLPLGEHNVTLYFETKYKGSFTASVTFTVTDPTPPSIDYVYDVGAAYEDELIPADVDTVTITVAPSDNYDSTDDLLVYLYSWRDDQFTYAIPMSQPGEGSMTYSAELEIEHSLNGLVYNYTYYVEVTDTSGQSTESAEYEFSSDYQATMITTTTPGFGIIAGLFGAAVAAFLLKKKLK